MIKIIIDIMNGEIECHKIIQASLKAIKKDKNLKLILVGDENILLQYKNFLNENLEFKYSTEIVKMDDDPIDIFFNKKNSSLMISMNLLKENYADAMVSMSNTGALLTCASLVIKKIKKIRKAALCSLIPNKISHTIMLDCGANINCSPEHMLQFAIMGKLYAEKVLNITNPRISILNNGIEKNKGRTFEKETYDLLNKLKTQNEKINFIGNIEPLQIFEGKTDVIICDGFVGNLVLKSLEATSKLYIYNLNILFKQNMLNKICALILKKQLLILKNKFNSKNIGGIPLLGIAKPIIKAHGTSDILSIYNAIFQAKYFFEKNIINHISNEIKNKEFIMK